MPKRLLSVAILAFMACFLAPVPGESAPGADKAFLFEDFYYSAWGDGPRPMMRRWEKVLGREPAFVASQGDRGTQYIELSNGIFCQDLQRPLSGSFTVSAEVLFYTYSRSLWFGVIGKTEKEGRCAVWCSALEEQFSGQGWAEIRSFNPPPTDSRAAAANPNEFSTRISEKKTSGHVGGALAPPFAKIDLNWDDSAKEWNLFIDGKWLSKAPGAVDLGPSPRLYFGGGNGVYFRNISISLGNPTP